MKRSILIMICSLICYCSMGQTTIKQCIGTNVLELTNLTVNTNYSIEVRPFLTPLIEIGYAFNNKNSFYLTEELATPHLYNKNNSFTPEKLTGGYLKLGTYFNLRRSFEKQNFFHFGVFLNNSIVSESGCYYFYSTYDVVGQEMSHTIYVPKLDISGGYEFSIFNRIKSNIDFQISFPGKNYQKFYGYTDLYPGSGYKETPKSWFPMLIWNLKYEL